jgi:DNA-binding winged helix-turn-helix (wHTH) protein
MVSPPSRPDPYVFGRFTLAADASLLMDRDVPIPLAPKVLQTLRALVQHAGRVVSKDDLMREVWGETCVEETGLTRNISLLRRALGPDGDSYIVTVPRIGYRFTAAVEAQGVAAGVSAGDELFVGRASEFAFLRAALARARGGRGTVVGLSG